MSLRIKKLMTTTLIQGTGSNYKSEMVIINESGLCSPVLFCVFRHVNIYPQITRNPRVFCGKREINHLII